jgi:hypothetical protein
MAGERHGMCDLALTVVQAHKKFSAFHRTQPQVCKQLDESTAHVETPSLISPHLCLYYPSSHRLSGFLKKISCIFLTCCLCDTCLADLVLISSPSCQMDSTHFGASCCLIFFIFMLLQSTVFHSKSFFFGYSQSVCLSPRARQQKCKYTYCKD